MGKLKCILKSMAALSLSTMLTVNSVPAMAIAAVNEKEAIVIENEDSEIITENETTEEASDNKDTGKKTEEKAEIWERTQSVNEMTVTVTADAGVFPDDAELSVKKVSRTQEKEAEKAVESERDEEENVAKSYTYDIKVLDKDGNEIEPNDDENVKVSFRLDEVADENLTTNIYHIKAEESDNDNSETVSENNLTAEKLEVETDGDTATAETDGFSLYTVEFTYNDLQYVMNGDSSIALSEILDKVELTGEVSAVEVSDESLFSAEKKDGEWVITAHKAFDTDEWMKVIINDLMYEISVTDTQSVTYIDENGIKKSCSEYTVLNGSETSLSAGWYVVNSTINYTHTITGSGNINIILADGGKMNIGSESKPIEADGLSGGDSLTIYGQTGGTGELNSFTDKRGHKAINIYKVTINGGKIKAIAKDSWAIYAYSAFNYNGGQVIASGNTWDGVYSRNTTLSWTNSTDFIEANDIYYSYNFATITIADGKTFTDGSKYYIPENASEIGSLKNTRLRASTTSAYGVTFNSNGGSAVNLQIVTKGSKAAKPTDPGRDGCDFGGWYEDEKLTKAYSFNTTVNKSFTLYAKWIPNDYAAYFGADNDGSAPEKAYIISSADGWDYFCEALQHNDLWGRFEGKYLCLGSDITVTKTAGSDGHEFMGTFDGSGHTINANLSGTDNFVAPFSYVKNAVIKRLNVTGTVSGKMHCAGLVGSADGTLTIQNCNVGVNVSSSGTHCGGILGHGKGATASIKDCLFSGSITGAGTARGIFYGWGDSGASSIENCLVRSTFENSENIDFYKKNGGTVNVTNCYKTVDIGEYGNYTEKSGDDLKILLGSGWTTSGDNVVPIMSDNDLAAGYLEGIKPVIPYPGNSSILISSLVVKNGKGNVLAPSNYDISCTLNGSAVNEIKNPGRYKITVTGKGDYTGVLPYNCHVLTFEKEEGGSVVTETLPDENSVIVDSTITEMKNNYYVVDNDVTVSSRISVKGAVSLILSKGTTLNAAKGISVTGGNSLTIYCEDGNTGKLIASNTDNYYAGIGGDRNGPFGTKVKSGNIVIHGGEINAKGAFCSAGIGAAYGGEAGSITIYGGQITARSYPEGHSSQQGPGIGGTGAEIHLGWCHDDDFIDSAGYQGTVCFDKNFFIDGTAKVATTQNAGGNKIVPSNAAVCKVDFDSNGGSEVTQQSIVKGQTTKEPLKPRKSGYGFGGWYSDNALSMPYNFSSAVNSSFTLYAKWVKNAAISYVGEDGALISGFTDYIPLETDYQTLTAGTYYVGSNLILSDRVEMEGSISIILGDGYTLTTPEGISIEPEDVLSIYGQKGGTGKLVATAYHGNSAIGGDHWEESGEINIYGGTISASCAEYAAAIGGSDKTGGSTGTIRILGGKVSAIYGDSWLDFRPAIGAGKNNSTATIILGYTSPDDYIYASGFNGSVSVADGKILVTDDSTPVAISGTVDDNSKINGKKLTPKKHTVSFDTNGGTGSIASQSVAHGLKAYLPTVTPTRTGYTVGDWMNGDSVYNFDTTVTTDMSLKLSWTANTYSVRFDKNASNASGTMADQSFTYDEAEKKLTKNTFSRPEYRFAGWNTKADGKGTSYTDGQAVRNLSAVNNAVVTLYAQWTAKTAISPVVSITGWTYGNTANTPEVTASSNPGSGTVIYEYFEDSSCTIKTTTANSGTESEGGVPKNAGTWYVKATVAETAQYKSGKGTAKFTISPKEVTITGLSVSNKEYDGTKTATIIGTATISDVLNTDSSNVSVTAGSASFVDANAGTNKTVTFTGYSISGTAAGNYNLSAQPASVTADITARPITITAKDQSVELNKAIATGVDKVSITSGSLVSGHSINTITIATENARNQVGEFSNAITVNNAVIKNGLSDVTANYNISYVSGKLTVTKVKAKVTTAPTAKTNLKYTGAAQDLITAGAADTSMEYAFGSDVTNVPDSGYGTTISKKDAGTYYIWYRAKADDNHNASDARCITVTIGKAVPNIETVPTASAITYGDILGNSTLTEGVAKSGNTVVAGTFAWKNSAIKPAVSDSNHTEYDIEFTPDNSNYDKASCKVKLTVNKADSAISSIPTAKENLKYNGNPQELVVAGSATGGTMSYAVTEANTAPAADKYSSLIPTAKNAKTYYVWYKVKGDSNHNDTVAASIAVTIEKGTDPALVTTKAKLEKNGKTIDLSDYVKGAVGAVSFEFEGEKHGCTINGNVFTSGSELSNVKVRVKIAESDNYNARETDIITVSVKEKIIDISSAEVTLGNDLTYNGYEQTMTVLSVKVDGEVVEAENYTITGNKATDAGDYTLTITAKDDSDYIGTVTKGYTVNKADGDSEKPAKPEFKNKSATTIEVTAKDGYEYSIDDGANWQSSGKFEGLTHYTEYSIITRKTETKNYKAGTVSDALHVWTDMDIQDGEDADSGIKREIKDHGTISGGTGEIETEAIFEPGVPHCTIGNLTISLAELLLTDEERKAVMDGTPLLLALDMKDIDDSVSEEDVNLTEDAAKTASSNAVVGSYLDLTLKKKIGNEAEKLITDTKGNKIHLELDVPDKLKNTDPKVIRTFYIIRIHGGVAEIIAFTTDTHIPFDTDLFSTYAIAYSDLNTEADNGTAEPEKSRTVIEVEGTNGVKVSYSSEITFMSKKAAFESGDVKVYAADGAEISYKKIKIKKANKPGSTTFRIKGANISDKASRKAFNKKNFSVTIVPYEVTVKDSVNVETNSKGRIKKVTVNGIKLKKSEYSGDANTLTFSGRFKGSWKKS